MLIDDSAMIRVIFKRILAADYDIVECEDGADAMTKISSSVSLIRCDLNMPKMNGIEFVKALRAKEEFFGVPLIMVTTENEDESGAEEIRDQINGWLTKPVDASQLKALMQELIG